MNKKIAIVSTKTLNTLVFKREKDLNECLTKIDFINLMWRRGKFKRQEHKKSNHVLS